MKCASSAFLAEVLEEANGSGDAKAGAALGACPMRTIEERRTRDVEVHPLRLADELTHEERRGDGPTVLIAHMLQVGDVTAKAVAKILIERHAPERFALGFSGLQVLRGECVVVSEEA